MAWYGYFRIEHDAGFTQTHKDNLNAQGCGILCHELCVIQESIDGKHLIVESKCDSAPTEESINTCLSLTVDAFQLFANANECRQYKIDNKINWELAEE
jgi:hypothetical protein